MSNVTGLYLGRVEICLELLRKTNDIALQCTSKPLYELLLVGAIAGVESYLHARLRKEVCTSFAKCQAYVISYLSHNGNKRDKDILLKIALKSIKDSSINALPEGKDKDIIIETMNRHIYHNIKTISDNYFEPVCGLNLTKCRNAEAFNKLVDQRHRVVHDGGRVNQLDYVDLNIYDVCKAFKTAEAFIEEIETWFSKNGSTPLFYDDPTELDQF